MNINDVNMNMNLQNLKYILKNIRGNNMLNVFLTSESIDRFI